jgi:hypothetical protein
MIHKFKRSHIPEPEPEANQPQRSERRERRSPLRILLRVCGFASSGRVFSEVACTTNVSPSGCCLNLRTRPLDDTSVAVQIVPHGSVLAETSVQLLYQIVWMRETNQAWEVGLSALSRADLLQVAFASRRP